MKKCLPTLLVFLFTYSTYSQVISSFNWESGPVTQAVSGLNATSVSSSAVISNYGAGGKGLNPGTPKMDIDLVFPGSPYFDVPGIDFSVSFRREETTASLIKRGSQFNFGIDGGNLSVKFNISNGSGGSTTVNSGNIYSIPNDHAFHTYRFIYNSNTGIGEVFVDGSSVYTYNGTAGRPLYWTGAGNVVVGSQMDATGDNVAVLDNMLIQAVAVNAPLPVKLLSFTAQAQADAVTLSWTSTREEQFSHFLPERSSDGIHYSSLATVAATGVYTSTTAYSFTDATPLSPLGYYRLKMVDENGSSAYSDVKLVSFGSGSSAAVRCFPNPAIDHVTIHINNAIAAQYRCSLVTAGGSVQESHTVSLARGQQQFTLPLKNNLAPGVYMLQLENLGNQSRQAYTIVKQ